MAQAVAAYCTELKKPAGLKQRGARTICKDLRVWTGRQQAKILSWATPHLCALPAGGKTKAQSTNGEKPWLSDAEVEVVIAYIGEIEKLRLSAESQTAQGTCQLHLPSPSRKALSNWWCWHKLDRLLRRKAFRGHKNVLVSASGNKEGRAVNPFTKEAFYELLGDTVRKYNITE